MVSIKDRKILRQMFSHYDYVMTTAQLSKEKLYYRDIQRMLGAGLIEKVKRGYYHWTMGAGKGDVVIISRLFPDGILCMETALFYYGYSDRNPAEWNIATASELAEKFEVSVRTIYRDIDALSGAGIPIYAEAGRNGGIYLMNDFVMDKAVLTEEEKREILTALHSINSTSNIDNSQILQKLSAIFNVGSESWLEVDFSRWGNNGTDNAKFELLKSAVIQQKCVKITYANSYGTISERIIQPLKVLYKSMSWYLKAYCTEKQDYRIFKLTRIITLEMLSDTFDKKSFPELDEMSGQVYSTIVLRFAKEISYRVYDEFDNTQISTEENGDLIVSVEMPEDEWLIGYLLSFGTQVDIVEPAHLKDIVAKQAKSIYEKYKS